MRGTGFEFCDPFELRREEAVARYQYETAFSSPLSPRGSKGKKTWRGILLRVLMEKQRRRNGGKRWDV